MRYLVELWPALLPLLAFFILMMMRRNRAAAAGEPRPQFREGPWFKAVLISAAIATLLLIYAGISAPAVKGDYAPPHLEDGKLVPGKITP